MTSRIAKLLVVALLVLALPAVAQAQFSYFSDGGYLEFQVDKNGKVKKQKIFWVWTPQYDPSGSVTYEIFAWCTRQDAEGNYVGKNKAIFSKISLVGDGVQLSVGGKLAKKMKSGVTGLVSKAVSSAGIIAGSTSAVVGEATVQLKGKLVAGDIVFCAIDVTESPSS